MKMKHTLFALLGTATLACSNHADTIASYDAGVSPTAGTTGAADPTGQGWATNVNATNAYLYGADSTIGGWRITDGTNDGYYYYSQSISSGDAADMASLGWTATWTTAVSRDAVRSNDVPNGVDNYYNAGVNQTNNAMWVEVAGAGLYVLYFRADANNDIQVNDGTSTFQITSDNNRLSEELGTGAPSAFYVTYTLSYDPNTGDATLTDSLGGDHGVIATSGAGSTNRVVWGATGGGTQGSTVWNSISVDTVPEPSSLALLGLGGLLIARRRRG